MRLDQLERNNKLHHFYADSMRREFARIWRRPLSADEEETVDTSVMCRGFMSLEFDELSLTKASDPTKADETFGSLAKSVVQHRQQIYQALADFGVQFGRNATEPARRNLLEFEDELLRIARSRAIGSAK